MNVHDLVVTTLRDNLPMWESRPFMLLLGGDFSGSDGRKFLTKDTPRYSDAGRADGREGFRPMWRVE